MKSYIIVAALSVLTGGLSAQTSIEDVLRSVEANNKDLQANSQLVQSQKLEAKLDNNLPDPSVSYSHFWGNKDDEGEIRGFGSSRDGFSSANLVAGERGLPRFGAVEPAEEPIGYPS